MIRVSGQLQVFPHMIGAEDTKSTAALPQFLGALIFSNEHLANGPSQIATAFVGRASFDSVGPIEFTILTYYTSEGNKSGLFFPKSSCLFSISIELT